MYPMDSIHSFKIHLIKHQLTQFGEETFFEMNQLGELDLLN